MSKKKSPMLLEKYEKIIAEMDGNDVKQIIIAVYAYNRCEDKNEFSFDFDTETARMVFMMMQGDYEAIERYKEHQRQHGKRGGNPILNNDEDNNKTLNQPLTNPYPTLKGTLTNPYPKDKDKGKGKDNKKKDIPIGISKENDKKSDSTRHKYGEYKNVLLTDNQYEELAELYPLDYHDRIERLGEYMSSTGKVYKNHLTTIKAWDRMNKERKTKTRAAPNSRIFRSGSESVYSDDIYEVF